ncbi:MAG: AraC family transcriptional regulator [Bacteroidales bacterium]|nr:AraC family transcriptional regulator [Bacteroidales bacterium]
MKYILLIAAFNALFFMILLWQKKPRAMHDHILGAWLVYLGLITSAYAFSSHLIFARNPLLSVGLIASFMLHGPFLFLYISALATKKDRLSRGDFLHFIPCVAFMVYLLVSSMFSGYADRIRIDHVSREIAPPLLFSFFLILTALSGPVYFVLSARLFRKLDIHIFNNFSYSEAINLDWLRKLVFSFGVIWSALIIIAVIHHVFHLFSMSFCTDGLFLSLAAFIILIGYFGLKQKEIFVRHSGEAHDFITGPKAKYAGSSLKGSDMDRYVSKLKHHMETEKPFLDENLTLPRLGAATGIPSHHLSRVINEHFGQNFFDFVNRYRVEEVKARIADPAYGNNSLLGIAFESGFNSKSAFNRVFKNMTGLTPSKYRETV